MSFWGMSRTGKDARGMLNEIPNWQWQQAKDWWGKQNEQLPIADQMQQFLLQELQKRYGAGFGSPADLRGLGQQIMPGVDEAIARRQDRSSALRQGLGNIPSAADVSNRLSGYTDEYGNTITGAYDDAQGAINRAFGGMGTQADQYGRDIVGNIGDSYGAANRNAAAMTDAARRSASDVYGGIGSDIGSTYGNIDDLTSGAFGKAESTLARMDPNSEFRAARTARAYAPAAASTALRLRKAGIDPSSLEGNAALQSVQNARARGMDDAYAAENEKYIQAANALTLDKLAADRASKLGRLGASTGASERGLHTDIGLSEDWKKMLTDMTLGQGKDFRSELQRQLGTNLDLDSAQLGASLSNLDKGFQRGQDYYNRRRDDTLTGTGLAVDEYGREIGQANRENADDLIGLDLGNQQFDRGVAQQARELGATGTALGGLGDVGSDAWRRAVQAGGFGSDLAGTAMQGYGNTLGRESANAGWGTKLLTNLGLSAASLIPGVGPYISMFGNAALGGGRGFPGMTQMPSARTSNARTPAFNPNAGITGGGGSMFLPGGIAAPGRPRWGDY